MPRRRVGRPLPPSSGLANSNVTADAKATTASKISTVSMMCTQHACSFSNVIVQLSDQRRNRNTIKRFVSLAVLSYG